MAGISCVFSISHTELACVTRCCDHERLPVLESDPGEQKGKPRCCLLKIHPVLYCSQKQQQHKGESWEQRRQRGERLEMCITVLRGLSNTLSSPTSNKDSNFVLTNSPISSDWEISAVLSFFIPGENQQRRQHFTLSKSWESHRYRRE